MGVIRGILLVFVAVLFFLSFLSLGLLWTLSSSLNYDNVQKQSTILVGDILKEVNINDSIKQIYPFIVLYCQNNSEYVLNYQGFTLDIPCSVALQGESAIIEEGIKDVIHNIYYTKYDCNFIDCFGKSTIPLFLISEKSYNFFKEKMFFPLIASLGLFVLVFLLVKKKTNAFILSGILLIVSGIPFIKLDSVFSLIPEKMISNLLWIFFSQSFSVSIKMIILGAVFLVFGVLLDLFKVGFFISRLISKIKGEKEEKTSKKSDKKKSK